MYVNVALKANLGKQLVVPASAVLESGLRHIVFIDRGEGRFDPKEIQLGNRVGDLVVVTNGLEVHQKIVTSANFLIDSESQIQAAAGASEAVPSAPSSAGLPSTAQLKIEFTRRPSPPTKGSNRFIAVVTNPDGSPCTGAEVSATFFMAAMPAMGMPSSHVEGRLIELGAGTYTGVVTLNSGGTWQVTITVKRAGQVVAVKKASIDAAGGM